jgi:hypothetical protein
VERKIEPYEVDVQAAQVLSGLSQLEKLLEEPKTEEALDLAKNARTTEQYNILRRLRKSLTQYLEREGDLFYVGLVGHFSSGKSSTIESARCTSSWTKRDFISPPIFVPFSTTFVRAANSSFLTSQFAINLT